MKTYRVYQVDSFTKTQFTGNPAGVVPNADGLTDNQMQNIARELNVSETAFILSPTSGDHDVWVRFFTPSTEVPSCGHATIAAHYVRAFEENLESCSIIQKIGIGNLPVDIIKADGDYNIVMTQGKPEFEEFLAQNECEEIVNALGLDLRDMNENCPMQVASTGHSKVMVGINSLNKLHTLKPNFQKLSEVSGRINCKGYYVFVLDSPENEFPVNGRMFAPAIGIPEDPVTGNANGPLGAYLVHHKLVDLEGSPLSFSAKQGEAMGRSGVVNVTVDHENGVPKKVKVAGKAVIVFQTEIRL